MTVAARSVRSAAFGPATRAFTLIELLVVIAIVMALMGIGAAAFQRQSARMKADAVASTVDTAIRQARNSAVSTGAPAFVELDDQHDPQRVVAWGYRVVGMWHFEEGGYEAHGAFNHMGVVRGCKSVEGKVGKALYFDGRSDVDCGTDPEFDLEDGGYLEAYVLGLTDFAANQFIFNKKNAYGLSVGRNGLLTGYVGSQQIVGGIYSLPPKRWTKVGFAWDRRNSRLLVDDAVVAVGPGMLTPVNRESLLIGDEQASFIGMIDEVRVMAAIPGSPVELAGETKMKHNATPWKAIYFAPDGGLDVRYHTGPITVDLIQGEKMRSLFVSMLGLTKKSEVISLAKDADAEDDKKPVKAAPPPPPRKPLMPALPRKPLQPPSDTEEVGKSAETKSADAKTVEMPAEAKSDEAKTEAQP